MSHSINIRIAQQTSYDVYTGRNIWDKVIAYFESHYSGRKLFIAIDSRVDQLHGQKVQEECKRYFQSCHVLQVPEGEESKSIQQWSLLQDKLLENGVERSTPLLAVGGGVTGDVAGFAAASVLRGIPLVHMPTSLLAMVDSSIGGKTGINHSVGKNLIGAFYQPDAVFTDIEFLETLDRREWIGGLAEMLKYAAIRKPALFDQLEQAVEAGFKPSDQWLALIRESAQIKADIVQEDVHESGKRAWLNFGHTFAHALEKWAGYGNISHGEAVFTGMIAATYFSKMLGSSVEEIRFEPFKPLYNINVPGDETIPELIQVMQSDKKVKEQTIRLVLLKKWGAPYLKKCENELALHDSWKAAFDALQ